MQKPHFCQGGDVVTHTTCSKRSARVVTHTTCSSAVRKGSGGLDRSARELSYDTQCKLLQLPRQPTPTPTTASTRHALALLAYAYSKPPVRQHTLSTLHQPVSLCICCDECGASGPGDCACPVNSTCTHNTSITADATPQISHAPAIPRSGQTSHTRIQLLSGQYMRLEKASSSETRSIHKAAS